MVGIIAVARQGANNAAIAADRYNKGVRFKDCVLFADCITEINIIQGDNAKDLDIVMPMYNSIEYGDNYTNKTGGLWYYYGDEPADDNITNSEQFRFKSRLTNKTNNAVNVNTEIAMVLKNFRMFWMTFDMAPITCEITLDQTWSANSVICEADREKIFTINDTKFYVPVSTQDNVKLLQ